MRAAYYLDEAKKALVLSSDYALAKHLGIRKQRIQEWRCGRSHPDAYACTVLAVALNLDPARVIAEVQAEAEKDPKRAGFWRSFLSRASRAGLLAILASIFSGIYAAEPANAMPNNVYYVKLYFNKATTSFNDDVAALGPEVRGYPLTATPSSRLRSLAPESTLPLPADNECALPRPGIASPHPRSLRPVRINAR